MSPKIFIGTDSGATTTKIAAVWENGEAITTKLLQRPTNAQNGRDAVIVGWVDAITDFLGQNQLDWAQVQGVGLAIPGPYKRYGVMERTPNLPANFEGWEVHKD
jgi:glucokinase